MRDNQQVKQFIAFLDMLSNPEEQRKTLEEMRLANEESERYISVIRKIEDVDKWRASILVDLQKEEASLVARESAVAIREGQVANLIKDHSKRVDADAESNKILLANIADRETRVSDIEKLRGELIEAKSRTEAKEAEYIEKLDQLNKREKALKDLVSN